MTPKKKIGIAAASLAAAAVAGFGVVAASTSALAETPTATPTATAPAAGGEMRGGHAHTAVTGDEAQKVIDAVKAKDSAVTITTVMKDADGSYDAVGTKAGAHVRFEVSSDLKTITEGAGGKGGGMGGHAHTAVTGDEAQKVMDAVKAKDSAVSITTVMKDADGSYDAVGTKAGAHVRFEVSSDLKTITEGAGGRGGGMGDHAHTAVTGDEAQKVMDAVKAKDSAVTITTVMKDADGSYDAVGTKAGAHVRFEVSSDLKTITEGGGKR